jgi:DNA-binding transcriptional regulator LsrR (DeoR family)
MQRFLGNSDNTIRADREKNNSRGVTRIEFDPRAVCPEAATFARKVAEKSADTPENVIKSICPSKVLHVEVCHSSDVYGYAARHIWDLVCESKRIGVQYGRSVEQLIDAMKRHVQKRPHNDFEVLPLSGDPLRLLNRFDVEHTASYLATRLQRLLGGEDQVSRPTLTGVPAYVGQRYHAALPFVRSIPGHQEIFSDLDPVTGQHTGLVSKTDLIITGVGIVRNKETPLHLRNGTFIRERQAQEDVGQEIDLAEHFLGDIAGVLIPANDAGETTQLMDEWNEGWTGMNKKDLEASANSPARKVAVIAVDESKATVIKWVVDHNLADSLVVSESLAKRLKSLVISDRQNS